MVAAQRTSVLQYDISELEYRYGNAPKRWVGGSGADR